MSTKRLIDSRRPKVEYILFGWGNPVQDVTRPEMTGDEWAKMTAAERISQCHAFAREAMQLAHAARRDKKQQYRVIAAQWNTLAAEMENAAAEKRPSP